MKSLIVSLACIAVLGAQTEVRRAVAPLPSYKSLKFPPLPPIKIPDPLAVTLPNGMKVFLLENHELPIVSGFALIRTGNLFDPKGKLGLAEVTGDVIRSGGTKAKTGDQIDTELENMAAAVESNIGESTGTVSFSALKENTDQVLSVFHDVLTAPEFRQDKIDLEKTQLRSAISRRNDDANGIVGREYSSILYGRDTPYGWEMQYSDAANIQRQDVIDFYRRYFFPANAILAVYGDFSTAQMQDKLSRLFADWTVKQEPVPKFPAVRETPVPGVFLAIKDDVTQTFFEVGHMGGVLRSKDYPALEVAADILGGGFSSRLFQRIRTRLGYAYNIGASWGAGYDHPGLFTISGSTQSMHTVDTLKAIREELDKLRSSEITDEELKVAKDTVLNGFVFRFDRPSKTLNRMITYEYYGYPKDFVQQYQKGIEAVTKQDVLRVAQKYFRPQDLTIVAVGNPAEFKKPITELGLKVQPIDLTIPEPTTESAPADAGSLQRGKQLLERVQQALGGAAKLASITDTEEQATVAMQGPGGAMQVKQKNSFIRPSIVRQDNEMPFGKQSVYFDGKAGWMSTPQGVQALPPPVIQQVRGEAFRELFRLALSDRNPDCTVNALDAQTLEISDKEGDRVQIALDPATGLPKSLSYSMAGQGGPSKIQEDYSDWRDVDGLKAPFKATILEDGKTFAEATVSSYKINSGLTPEQLSKKP